jgi:hypothetical protein
MKMRDAQKDQLKNRREKLFQGSICTWLNNIKIHLKLEAHDFVYPI